MKKVFRVFFLFFFVKNQHANILQTQNKFSGPIHLDKKGYSFFFLPQLREDMLGQVISNLPYMNVISTVIRELGFILH